MSKTIEFVRQEVETIKNEVEDFANSASRIGEAMSDILEYNKELTETEANRAKDVEQSLSEEINNIKEAISNIGGEGGEGSKEVTRAEFELVEAQSKSTFEAFSKLGMTEKADANGYEIALAKSTNTAEKTKVKVPVYDTQDPSKTPAGLVNETFVEDMASMMDGKIEDALKDFTPEEGGGSTEVVDSLDSTSTTAALSANQGRVLNEKIGDWIPNDYGNTIAENLTTINKALEDSAPDEVPTEGSQSTVTSGGVYQAIKDTVSLIPVPDEEDVTKTKEGKLKFADREYNSLAPDGMGYVILRKNKALTEQITSDINNTIYEVRYNFDLGGETVHVGSGCVLKFVGGNISNGTIIGEGLGCENVPDTTLKSQVFVDGYNLFGNSVRAEDIGMVPDESGSAEWNGNILKKVVAKGMTLEVNAMYYIETYNDEEGADKAQEPINVTGKISIVSKTGGELYVYGSLFKPEKGADITFDGVTFKGEGAFLIHNETRGMTSDTTDEDFIESIRISNCTFDGITRVIHMVSDDVAYTDTYQFGIKRLVIDNNRFVNIPSYTFLLTDVVVRDECMVKSNYVEKFKAIFFNFSTDNTHGNSLDNINYNCDIYIQDNVATGTAWSTLNYVYYTFALVESGGNFYYEKNNVSNVVQCSLSTNAHPAYDCYASCKNYICRGNIFKNICNLPKDGKFVLGTDTPSEMFKSKGVEGLRIAENNSWYIDFNECRKLAEDVGVLDDTFTDEMFEAINFVTIFGFTDIVDVEFVNNNITIKNGKLMLYTTNATIKTMLFKGNSMVVDDVMNGKNDSNNNTFYGTLINSYDTASFTVEKIDIANNLINVGTAVCFNLVSDSTIARNKTNCNARIVGNTSNCTLNVTDSFKKITMDGNRMGYSNMRSSIRVTGNEELSDIELSLFATDSKSFYLDDVKKTNYHLKLGFSNGIQFKLAAATGVEYGIRLETNEGQKTFLISSDSSKAVVTDEYGNVVYDIPTSTYGQVLYLDDRITIAAGYSKTETSITFTPKDDVVLDCVAGEVSFFKAKLNQYIKGIMRFAGGKPQWWNGTAWVDATGATV